MSSFGLVLSHCMQVRSQIRSQYGLFHSICELRFWLEARNLPAAIMVMLVFVTDHNENMCDGEYDGEGKG